ncbi:SIMPL domain-containing protein [Streptomyces sp. SP18ES09]|uniref:SIMPL domain-containing protein n=1 Tax=Streptomyces sp. SP18ES09 TaxID=3002532 RepID=UPI002E76466F|nr:SIMPL domain-containing protein [Streptomyces sp. SP18ES09]MEE1816897.1 SIMPL domain-containing protein [Streptomyces sp. SP18ES09]
MTIRRPSAARTARLLAATAVLGGLLAGTAAPALAAAPVRTGLRAAAPAAATVTVTGNGRASAAPDLAILSVGVEVARPTAKEAMAAQSKAAEALLDVLRRQEIEDRDIRTDSLALTPVYTQTKEGESKVTGYQAAQSFSVKVRVIDRTGQVVGAVNDATGAAGRVNGVVFDVADPSALRATAREAAYRDAYDKASQHARLSGHRLGRLVSLSEGESVRPGPGAAPGFAADETGVPLAPGEIEEQVTVSAVYELV